MTDSTPDTALPEDTTGTADPSVYSAIVANDAALRAFIVKHYGASAYDIDGKIFVENCMTIFKFVKTGELPASATRGSKAAKPTKDFEAFK